MRLAVLSDIHSNYAALEACLDYVNDMKGSDTGIVFLGDYVSDCPYPQRTMALLREAAGVYPCWFIRGNREDYQVAHHLSAKAAPDSNRASDWKYGSATGSLLYTYENLTEEDITWFATLPAASEVCIDGLPGISICHGSPTSTREAMEYGSPETGRHIASSRHELLLCGHIHEYFEYTLPEGDIHNTGRLTAQCALKAGRRLIACPSVGLAYDRCAPKPGVAGMLVLESNGSAWQGLPVWVNYDFKDLLNAFDTSGLSDVANCWARSIRADLSTGINYSLLCVQLAVRLATDMQSVPTKRPLTPGEVPESCWEAAASQLNL